MIAKNFLLSTPFSKKNSLPPPTLCCLARPGRDNISCGRNGHLCGRFLILRSVSSYTPLPAGRRNGPLVSLRALSAVEGRSNPAPGNCRGREIAALALSLSKGRLLRLLPVESLSSSLSPRREPLGRAIRAEGWAERQGRATRNDRGGFSPRSAPSRKAAGLAPSSGATRSSGRGRKQSRF